MKLNEFIKTFAIKTKKMISWLDGYKELSNEEKKKYLDSQLLKYVETVIDTLGLNFVFKFVLKHILIDNISSITQTIFDLIKIKDNEVVNNEL